MALAPITHPLLTRAGVRHGFFTRQGGVSTGLYDSLNTGVGSKDDLAAVAENRRRVANHLGGVPDDLAACYPIHSAVARVAEAGDTLQALRRHQKVDPLESPGEADLTQWADFPTVLEAAVHAGADVTGCLGQGEFLQLLGIEARADRLKDGRPDAAPIIGRQLARLTADDQMGALFKACAIFSPRSLVVPGFED